MNLSLLFKIQGVVLIVNGLGSLFLGSIWIALGTGWEATPDLITFGQFTGVVLFVVGIWSWRFPDIASENLKSIGMLFAFGSLLFTGIILFHIVTGVIAGATPYVNVILTALFTLAFYIYSRS